MPGQPSITRRAAIGAGVPATTSRRARAAPITLKLATADTINDTSYEVGRRIAMLVLGSVTSLSMGAPIGRPVLAR
jgi:hypothetical protein